MRMPMKMLFFDDTGQKLTKITDANPKSLQRKVNAFFKKMM
jgi:hypothetical protein